MTELDQSVASNLGTAELQNLAVSFLAPAAQEWGGQVTVFLLLNAVGHGGAVACRIADDTIRRSFLTSFAIKPLESIKSSLAKANEAIRLRQASSPEAVNSGCAIVCAVVVGDRLFVESVGDNRAFLVREREIRPLAADATWVQQALQSWHARPGDIQDHPVTTERGQYLGKEDKVEPRIAPVEFLWPNDVVLFVTAPLAAALRDQEIRDVVMARGAHEASRSLVQHAMERGVRGNVTNMLIRVAEPAPPVIASPLLGGRGLLGSPIITALILGNLILICLVLAVFVGGSSFLSPSTNVEVARPLFLPTATLTPGLDIGKETATPTVLPAPSTPTLGPASTPLATPVPTSTSTSTPAAAPPVWVPPPPPALVMPADGFVFNGPQANVTLAWDNTGPLPEDVFYVVTIKKWVNGKFVGESLNWTKANRIRLDQTFYSAYAPNTRPAAIGAAETTGSVNQFEWSVALYRVTLIKPDGTLEGTPVTNTTTPRHFTWGPALSTRVYGG